MNERIRELAEQAGIKEYPAKLSVSKEDDGTTSTKWEYPLEKFAELIVRECGVALSPMLRDMVSRGQAYDLIKQHFGVEL